MSNREERPPAIEALHPVPAQLSRATRQLRSGDPLGALCGFDRLLEDNPGHPSAFRTPTFGRMILVYDVIECRLRRVWAFAAGNGQRTSSFSAGRTPDASRNVSIRIQRSRILTGEDGPCPSPQ